MENTENSEYPEVIQYKQNLYQRYLNLGEDLRAGRISPEEFAKSQTKLHLELEELADYDGALPAFLNRRGFEKGVDRELKELERLGVPASLLALDIDRLRVFNNSFGHIAGDALIQTYGNVIEANTRASDLRGRVGGDEFCILLIGDGPEQATLAAERIRAEIIIAIKEVFPDIQEDQTVSIGLTDFKSGDTATTLRKRADDALLKAKERRNTTVVYPDQFISPAS